MTNWKAREALDARFRRFCCKSSKFEEAKRTGLVGDSAKKLRSFRLQWNLSLVKVG
jgi:hypothetical protein